MSIEYKCPHCTGLLNVNDCVLFSVETPGSKKGLISLHSEIGDYSVKKNPAFEFKDGDVLDFFCPICHAELASNIHDKLAKIHMIDENNNDFEILFSKIAGEKSTYKIIGETMNIYGDDSAEYVDFINLSSMT